jgi:hypothetical protein
MAYDYRNHPFTYSYMCYATSVYCTKATCIHFITCTLAKPYAPCVEAESISRTLEVEVADSSNLSLTPTACNDFSWSLHIFHFSQLYFWSIVELAPLKLSGTGDNLQLRVERETLRTIVLVGHTPSNVGWGRGLYVQGGTVHSLHGGRMSLPAFIASEGWKFNTKLQSNQGCACERSFSTTRASNLS